MKGVETGMIYRKTYVSGYLYLMVCIVLPGLIALSEAMAKAPAQQISKETSNGEKPSEEPKPKKAASTGPVDEYKRGNLRSCVREYFKAARGGDYKQTANYLDLRNLPQRMNCRSTQVLSCECKWRCGALCLYPHRHR